MVIIRAERTELSSPAVSGVHCQGWGGLVLPHTFPMSLTGTPKTKLSLAKRSGASYSNKEGGVNDGDIRKNNYYIIF